MPRARHILMLLFGWSFVSPGLGCDLPPIPTFRGGDTPAPTSSPDGGDSVLACEPSVRKCVGNSVRTCSLDGADFTIDACGVGETCSEGSCSPIQNTCRGGQPFALSRNELTFDISDDLKSQTAQLRIENCGTTTFILREAVVRGPSRPDGTPVFRLETEVGQTSVPPGDVLELKVMFRPTAGLSHVSGKLELSLVLDELTNLEIGLRSKAVCAAASPITDFGLRSVGEEASATGVIQNCGTEPIRLEGWEAPATYGIEVTEKVPSVLGPGAEMGFTVSTTPETPGFVSGEVRFAFEDPLVEPATKLRGLATESECENLLLSEHQVLVNNQPAVDQQVAPGSLVRIRFPDAPADLFHWVRLADRPSGSHETLARGSDGFTMRPRVIGPYVTEVTGFDVATGRPSCTSSEVVIDVVPGSALHVELAWTAGDDSIPEDPGYGRGMNLDLHVLSTEDGEGQWNEQSNDCFAGVLGPCGAAGGAISISESGAIPEFATFDDVAGLQFEVGVYLSNPFSFASTQARVRVFRSGALVATLEADSLQSANDFWLVGKWDEPAESWTKINRVFAGFPK